MGKTDDWMPLRRELWRNGTALMSAAARGAYMDLCLEYWVLGPLPNEDDVLQRLARCSDKEWRQVRGQVLVKFKETDGTLYHERLDTERAIAKQMMERKSAAGRAGGKASVQARGKQPSSNRSTSASTDAQPIVNTTYQVHSPSGEKHPSDVLATKPKRRSQIAPDWMPSDKDRAHAIARKLDAATVSNLIEPFRDHHTAKQTLSADWSANWRTWVANHINFNGTGPWPRPDAGRSGKNVGFGASPTAARDRILAKAGVVKEPDGASDHGVHADAFRGAASVREGAVFAGPIIDADEWQRVSGTADGTQGDDTPDAGDFGRRGGPTHGVSETADGMAGGRGAEGSDDSIGAEPVVAGMGGTQGSFSPVFAEASDDAGRAEVDFPEVPTFLRRTA